MGLCAFISNLFSSTCSGNNCINRDLDKFLNEVDAFYMEAYERKTIKQIAPYLSREFAVKLNRVVYQLNTRYFGVDKFRNTTWTLISRSSDKLILEKDVKFDKVRVAGRLKIDVAPDYKEKWYIGVQKSKYLVEDIVLIK